MFKKLFKPALIALTVAAAMSGAQAQEYPTKPVTIIVPTGPAGAVDFMARLYGEELSKKWKQRAVVENKVGAGGILGAQVAARSPADGYTIMVAPLAGLAGNVFRKMAFDPLKDLTPVALLAWSPQVCVTQPESGLKTWAALVADAKANPGKLTFVTYPGTTNHLYMLRLLKMTGMDARLIPYNSQTAGIQAVMSNQVTAFCSTTTGVPQLIQGGKLVGLAMTSRDRNPAFPDVPTLRSLGLDFEWLSLMTMFAPAGTPANIVAKLQSDVAEILPQPDIQARVRATGLDPELRSPRETAQVITQSLHQIVEFAREAGVKPEE